MTGIYRKQQASTIKDSDGKIITDTKQKLKRWVEYIDDLFKSERTKESQKRNEYTGPEILRTEVSYALKQTKGRKAVGPDELPIELVKLIDEEMIDILVQLYNNIYSTGIIPKQQLASTFIPMPMNALTIE